MGLLFLNAPGQNGEFTLTELPGKATGIRIAAALNQIMGAPPAPDLWNTATLAGDLRHREHTAAGGQMSREDLDTRMIAAEYPALPEAGTITDADRPVAELAIRIIRRRLRSGGLRISRHTVRVCARCGHMTGVDGHPCKACGCADSCVRTTRLLVADRDPAMPVLPTGRMHTPCRNPARHLRGIVGNAPARLILSRTRDHGIDLGPVGLPGLVLDPRAGLHTAALATAGARRVERAGLGRRNSGSGDSMVRWVMAGAWDHRRRVDWDCCGREVGGGTVPERSSGWLPSAHAGVGAVNGGRHGG